MPSPGDPVLFQPLEDAFMPTRTNTHVHINKNKSLIILVAAWDREHEDDRTCLGRTCGNTGYSRWDLRPKAGDKEGYSVSYLCYC